MSPVDALIVVAFVVYAVTVGLRNRRQASKNLEEYFLAGRSLPGWKAGLSMAATQFAADTPLLVTGLVATAGIFGLWQLWIFGVTFLVVGFVLAGAWRRAGVVTDAELTEVRYGADAGGGAALRQGPLLRHHHQLRLPGLGALRRGQDRRAVPAVARVAARLRSSRRS